MLSEKLRVAIKTSRERQYRLAQRAQVDPTVLSAWINGVRAPRQGDQRVVAIGRLVGVPADQCFDIDPKNGD